MGAYQNTSSKPVASHVDYKTGISCKCYWRTRSVPDVPVSDTKILAAEDVHKNDDGSDDNDDDKDGLGVCYCAPI